MKSKYKLSMSDKNLKSELKCILRIKYISDFGDLYEKNIKHLINSFCVDFKLKCFWSYCVKLLKFIRFFLEELLEILKIMYIVHIIFLSVLLQIKVANYIFLGRRFIAFPRVGSPKQCKNHSTRQNYKVTSLAPSGGCLHKTFSEK